MRDADPPEKKRFEQAVDGGFELVAQEGRFELRGRGKGYLSRANICFVADWRTLAINHRPIGACEQRRLRGQSQAPTAVQRTAGS